MTRISVIIPVYNEESVIKNCLESLSKQSIISETEIILVNDGSTDNTKKIIEQQKGKLKNLSLLTQNHLGPGAARNFGASKAKGEILVFVDADMEFDEAFLKDLTSPIIRRESLGTYSTEELLLNSNNPWAVCWNLNFFQQQEKALKSEDNSISSRFYLSLKYAIESLEQRVAPIAHQNISRLAKSHSHLPYRAIRRREFLSVGGFATNVGYTDDWTIAEKLNRLPTPVAARYYHRAPASLMEIYRQARWIGRGELMTGNLVRQFHALIIHNPLSGVFIGLLKAIQYKKPRFLIFRLIYDFGLFCSVSESFFIKNTAR